MKVNDWNTNRLQMDYKWITNQLQIDIF